MSNHGIINYPDAQAVQKQLDERKKELETLKQKKVRLEDELSKINSQAKFTFDLNDTIYTRIYGE